MSRGLVGALLLVLVLAGCSGRSRAYDAAGDAADQVQKEWSVRSGYVRDGSTLAAQAIDSFELGRLTPDATAVEALSWSGRTGTEKGAVVVLRVVTHVDESNDGGLGSTVPASDAVRCFRFTLGDHSNRHAVDQDGIHCPPDATAGSPTIEPKAELPGDVQSTIEQVLGRASSSTLEDDATMAFPHLAVSAGSDGKRLVLAVGAGPGGDCEVGVRDADGAVSFPGGFPREWLMPGELGCSADLVLNPPL